ncbi:hypothetical protein [Luteibacter sp. E-22]|uniref:hypothetical protein n=1 Tax=Luteibacter sp. E-22 TaxID=3404050 RepID=UPI003CFA768C
MPVVLVGIFKKPVIKRTLGTRELPVARDIALALWRAYDELQTHVRTRVMAGKTTPMRWRRSRKLGHSPTSPTSSR